MFHPGSPALLTRDTPRRPTPGSGLRPAGVASIAACVPDTIVENAPIAERLGVDDAWILKRTGIRARRVAQPGERLSDLAGAAGTEALKRAGISPADVDLVLCATTTADEILPNAAPLIADAVGATRAGAVDLGAACTGFLSGMLLATGLIETRRVDTVLLVGADFMTRITDPDCRATAAVFADGAGAAVLTATEAGGGIGPVTLGADGGAGAGLIVVGRDEALIRMQGQETFKHAVGRMTQATREALAMAELELDDIDLFVYHQANGRILRAVGEHLGVDQDRVIDCIGDYGNTSAATLPIALDYAVNTGRLHVGDRVLLGAFGAGFTWGAAVLEWGTEQPSNDELEAR